jgi:ABC-type multidrug transport system fused ATPase/permease subunit
MAFYFATAFEKLGAGSEEGGGDAFMDSVRNISYVFLVLGVIILTTMTIQATLMESAAVEMTDTLKTSWFDAMLRQDMEYFDCHDAVGEGMMITLNGQKFRRKYCTTIIH